MIQSPEIVQELFLSWLVEEVSPEQVPKLHTVVSDTCANIEEICRQKGFCTNSFFEIKNPDTLDSLSNMIRDASDDQDCISRMTSVLSLYYDFLEEKGEEITSRQIVADNLPASASEHAVESSRVEMLPGKENSLSAKPKEPTEPETTERFREQFFEHQQTKQMEEVAAVLKQHYEYGFKYESIRELMRFRQFAEEMGIVLPEEDELLKAAIMSSGTVIDDKVYSKSDDMPQELQRMVSNIFASGVGVIYYESLFENELEWMDSHVITSPDMLKKYLQKNIAGCSFSKKFMIRGNRRAEKDVVTEEIKRVWGEGQSESVHALHERLPYVPLGNVWHVLSGNPLFVPVSPGEYLFIDRFRITKDEEEEILDFVDRTCEENGFASLSNVSLGGIEEENYELTQLTIYNAVYKKVLSGKYHLNGRILTKEKSDLDAIVLLKQYLNGRAECTFDEVANKVVELTGGTNRQYAFQALYDDMVRVDRNRFVANRLVNFSVDEIDAVLSGFITDKFRAIRDITTFAMFPICGQNWNHYLLESYCYKFSRKYSLHVIHFNDRNAGIIAEKAFHKKYDDMLAIALARTNVELTPEIIGQYLFDTGYMAKRKYARLGKIAQQALALRKER